MAGFDRLADAVVRWRWAVGATWLLAAIGLLPFARTIEDRLTVAARVSGSESAAVERILAERFHSPFARWIALVIADVPSPGTSAGRAVLQRTVQAVRAEPGVTHTFSYLDDPDTLFVGAGGEGTFIIVGLDWRATQPERMLPAMRDLSSALEADLRTRHPHATLRWTGEIALNADIRQASAAAAARAEQRAMPLTLAVLLIAFGAVAAAMLPLLSAAMAVGVTLGVISLLASWWPLSIVLQNVVSMLGIGLGIDYALLVVSRFRSARRDGASARIAAGLSLRAAGPTVLLSAGTVAIGFAALLLVPLDEVRAIAVGGLVVALMSGLAATTLVPAVLAVAGAHLERGRLRRERSPGGGSWWRAWARVAVSHPVAVLTLSALPLCALAWQATRLDLRLPRGDWLPRDMESARAVRDLELMERGSIVQTIRIILELPAGMHALDHSGWRATSRLIAAVQRDSLVARVRALPTIAPGALPGRPLRSLIPEHVRATFVSGDGRATLLEVVPTNAASPNALAELVMRWRDRGALELSGVPGTHMLIGGIPAFNADYGGALTGRFVTVALVVIVATLLVLGLSLRSILVPLKAVALNLLSVAAAFGAMVVVFGDGIGIRFLGLEDAPGGTFPLIPILVFCIVFGLSMDYELFLVSRVAEARRRGANEGDAIVEGVVYTGGVISSAAAIMIVVFGAFMLGDVLLVQMLGFALAVAVVIDATFVRLAIGPALLRLAGRWNWWPGDLSSHAAQTGRSDPRAAAAARVPLPAHEAGASP